jgi:hypothetical protein
MRLMKPIIHLCGLLFLLILLLIVGNGCNITRAITVEYLPGSADNGWIKELTIKNPSAYRPTIAINRFDDERDTDGNVVGALYNRSGKKVETLITDESPTAIVEMSLIRQLEAAGFTIIRTSGWNFHPESIPDYLKTDFILGGRLKAFWVESKAGFLTSTIDSHVTYDLIIADARNKKIIWTGQIAEADARKSLAHTNDYFWADLQASISHSLTLAINQAFQDQQAQQAIITLIRVKF